MHAAVFCVYFLVNLKVLLLW